MVELVSGFELRTGWRSEQGLLIRFMQQTYSELFPGQDFSHIATAVDQHFSPETPLWWVEMVESKSDQLNPDILLTAPKLPIGCLWMGNAVDQVNSQRHSHIFLVYVQPSYRRRGIGKALLNFAETWAKQRGDEQISLQVFCQNLPALNLYKSCGYDTLSTWMVKRF